MSAAQELSSFSAFLLLVYKLEGKKSPFFPPKLKSR